MTWGDVSALWAIVEERSYETARDALPLDVRRLDEMLEGATWAIARKGDDDTECPEVSDGIRLVKTAMPGEERVIRVWYVLDTRVHTARLIYIDIWDGKTPSEEDLPW